MDKVLIVYGDKCTGCKLCELICSLYHVGECNPKNSRIRVLQNSELDVNIPVISLECDLCGECINWCLPEALQFVSHDEAAILRKKNSVGIFPAPIMHNNTSFLKKEI